MATVSNAIVQGGNVPITDLSCQVETATNMYPGRLCKKGTGDRDLVVATAGSNPAGWLGYEQAAPSERPANMTTAYAADDVPPVLKGGGFVILATLSTSQTIAKDDALVADAMVWSRRQVHSELFQVQPMSLPQQQTERPISGSAGTERIVGYAEESVTTTSNRNYQGRSDDLKWLIHSIPRQNLTGQWNTWMQNSMKPLHRRCLEGRL